MKKIFSILAVLAVSALFAANASAQFNYGVIGGATFSSAKSSDWKLTIMSVQRSSSRFRSVLRCSRL